ncbi:MAG: pyridoxine 5'-phosphate synthase [Bacteroidetes bacterium]|jgi:pyridoxine 5-phosphate synthase|nr:MAG: pyridoxine 5'-phosphate synthase [Cryomorphaceae bacterium BACL29 MAG-121220-bin8]MDA0757710.1 pyridoxine 5'-phosphate synthase [Bacteroidota bacterium]MDA1018854.1 pyridoxine 5'-phosphate synthase [Bacteroidota bacterium]|tara:strand:+ start:12828 stop:13556 length:729 start_codon:yes stop_codon:yes gene_type:complete
MVKLSVNINKIATIRNARGGNNPDLILMAKDIQSFGADGITIHPRPDERHITYNDAIILPTVINKEFNIEGNPIDKFISLVNKIKPDQVTLVPDKIDAITSNSGWDTIKNKNFLQEVISEFKSNGIRTSVFVDPELKFIEGAKESGADRVELYTESFAVNFEKGNLNEMNKYIEASILANKLNMGVNAGHDLNLNNINYFVSEIPFLDEVSIGHAIICESLYLGIENVINLYLQKIKNAVKK